jgi:hypothetical protein
LARIIGMSGDFSEAVRDAQMVPDALDALSGEERNRLYGMLRLEVTPASEGLEVNGAFCTSELRRTAT